MSLPALTRLCQAHHSALMSPTSGHAVQAGLPHRPRSKGEGLPGPSSSARSLQSHRLVSGWHVAQAGPRRVNPKTLVRRSAHLWAGGLEGSEESSGCWGPSGHYLGRACLRKKLTGSRGGQGGKHRRLVGTAMPPSDTACWGPHFQKTLPSLGEAGAGERGALFSALVILSWATVPANCTHLNTRLSFPSKPRELTTLTPPPTHSGPSDSLFDLDFFV